MIYRAIGVMSGSSLDGLDIVFAAFEEQGGKWSYEIKQSACITYDNDLADMLKHATAMTALDYQLLHTRYGHFIGESVQQFIEENNLQFQVALIASHGHTTFHLPGQKMTAQLGDGAAIAAETGLPVVTDLRAMDVALGGQGAPIVPVGEQHLLPGYDYFLNLGGIANISASGSAYQAFDICPANRVLNTLAGDAGKSYDDGGRMAASGKVNGELLRQLNQFDYYRKPGPKSLANEFGTDILVPLIRSAGISTADALRTYCEHISIQVSNVLQPPFFSPWPGSRLLVTGGGAHNTFLAEQLRSHLLPVGVELVIPEPALVDYKEALIMAFMGVLRWRQEENVLASVTGARHNSIGGALWMGQ